MDVPDLEQRAVYVCGPQAFMQSAKEQLLALGLHEDDYYEESFGQQIGAHGHKVLIGYGVLCSTAH